MTILENPPFYTRRQFFVASPFHVSLRIVVVKLSLNTLSRISGPKSCCIVVCREMKNMSHAHCPALLFGRSWSQTSRLAFTPYFGPKNML